MSEIVESSMAGLGPIRLPRVRHDRPQRPWWEAARLHSMHHHLGVDDQLIDCGSEMGDMTALFASWGVDVVAVEGNDGSWPFLRTTFEANDLALGGWLVGLLGSPDQATTVPVQGVDWSLDGFPPQADGPMNPETGFYSLMEHRDVVPTVTLDDLVDMMGLEPTAITLDVEGGELHLMQGASRTLEVLRPKVWISEHEQFARDMYGHDLGDLHELMSDAGYDRIFLATDHETHAMYLPKEMGWVW